MRTIPLRTTRLLVMILGLLPFAALAEIPRAVSVGHRTIGGFYSFTVCSIVNWIFGFVMLLAVVAFLYGALLFFTAGGDESKVSQARKMVTYAMIGVAVAVLSRTLVIIIASLVGVPNTNIITCT